MTATLNAIDKHSLTWQAIEGWAKAEQEKAVSDLIEGTPRDEALRGRIQAMKDLQELVKSSPTKPPTTDPTIY